MLQHLKKDLAKWDQWVSYRLYSNIGRKHQAMLGKYLKMLEYSCHGVPWLVGVFIMLYTLRKNDIYAQLLIGLVFDIIYVAVLKALARRKRPDYAPQGDQMLVVGVDKLSFPSGHSSRAIYVALFFSGTVFALPIWLWAVAVVASRVLLGRHFVGDALAGSMLGYWNYLTQYTLFYPIHSFCMWFILNALATGANDYDDI